VERADVVLEPSAGELAIVERAIACHDSQRNGVVDLLLSDQRLLFWMARSCYVRVNDPLSDPATDLLPELR
jgi:hypothetical protein